jgi:hypothetical protein
MQGPNPTEPVTILSLSTGSFSEVFWNLINPTTQCKMELDWHHNIYQNP